MSEIFNIFFYIKDDQYYNKIVTKQEKEKFEILAKNRVLRDSYLSIKIVPIELSTADELIDAYFHSDGQSYRINSFDIGDKVWYDSKERTIQKIILYANGENKYILSGINSEVDESLLEML